MSACPSDRAKRITPGAPTDRRSGIGGDRGVRSEAPGEGPGCPRGGHIDARRERPHGADRYRCARPGPPCQRVEGDVMSAPQAAQPQQTSDPLSAILAIESAVRSDPNSWDDHLRGRYCAALVALATGLRAQDEGTRLAFWHWLNRGLAALLCCRDETIRVMRIDAITDMVVEGEWTGGQLEAAAGRIRRSRKRPNLLSFLKMRLIHNARDAHRSRRQRYDDREVLVDHVDGPDYAPARLAHARVLIEQIDPYVRDLDQQWSLMLVGMGETIAEAARRTGLSRQQIYRLRERLRAAVDGPGRRKGTR